MARLPHIAHMPFESAVQRLMEARRTVLPKRLEPPGPDREQLDQILAAAACAPDHKQILPWRLVVIDDAERSRLADVFAASLFDRDPDATPEQIAAARSKAFRAPCLLLVIARTGGPPEEIPAIERMVSAGCAVQNMLLLSTAMGFATSLTSGKALSFAGFRKLFSVTDVEEAACFINIGTPTKSPPPITRPMASRYTTTLRSA